MEKTEDLSIIPKAEIIDEATKVTNEESTLSSSSSSSPPLPSDNTISTSVLSSSTSSISPVYVQPSTELSEIQTNEIKPVTEVTKIHSDNVTTVTSTSPSPPTTTTKTAINDEYLKVNGDHHVDDKNQSFLDCEESCASTASSSSSRNLIIDHLDDSQEEDNSKKIPLQQDNSNENKEQHKKEIESEETKTIVENENGLGSSIKRKLSADYDDKENKCLQNRKFAKLKEKEEEEDKRLEIEEREEENRSELAQETETLQNENNAMKLDTLDGNLLELTAFKPPNASILFQQLSRHQQQEEDQAQEQQKENESNSIETAAAALNKKLDSNSSSPFLEEEQNQNSQNKNEMNEKQPQLTVMTKEKNVINLQQQNNNLKNNINNIEHQKIITTKEHFQEYAQYLGLKPSMKYKCFKCLNSSYDTLNELRDHQKICLFKRSTNSHHLKEKNNCNINSSTTLEDIFRDSSSRFATIQQHQQQLSNNNQQTITSLSRTTLKETNHNRIDTTATVTAAAATTTTATGAKLSQAHQKHIFLCSACGTYYEQWNLFLHMREIHKRHVCLYCFGMFPNAERLTLHLEMKHDLEQNHFDTQEKLLKSSKDTCYLMCCICEYLFTEHENFSEHNCNDLIKPCPLCNGPKGKHSIDCKATKKRTSELKLSSSSVSLPSSSTTTSLIVNKTVTTNKQKKERLKRKSKFENKNKDGNNQKIQMNDQKITTDQQQQQPQPQQNLDVNRIDTDSNYPNNADNSGNNDISISGNENFDIPKTDITNINCDNLKGNKHQQYNENMHNVKLNGCVTDPMVDVADKMSYYPSVPSAFPSTLPPFDYSTIPPRPVTMASQQEQQQHNQSMISQDNSFQHYQTQSNFTDVNSTEMGLQFNMNSNNNCEMNNQLHLDNTANNNDDSNNQFHTDSVKNTNSYERAASETEQQISLPNFVESNLIRGEENITTEVSKVQNDGEEKRLVPKFKLKIPKNYQQQVAIESDQSSSESGADGDTNNNSEEEVDEEENKSEHEEHREQQTNDEQLPTDSTTEDISKSEILHETDENNTENQLQVNEKQPEDEMNLEEKGEENEEKMDIEDSRNSSSDIQERDSHLTMNDNNNATSIMTESSTLDTKLNTEETLPVPISSSSPIKDEKENLTTTPSDGIEVADEDVPVIELLLSQPLDKIEMLEFLRICLRATYPFCLYCNHARRIAVNGYSFTLHLIGQHRFSATVDSITAEELLPSTIVTKLKSFLSQLNEYYFNLETYCNQNKDDEKHNQQIYYDKIFECFQCRFETRIHKELYLHNRKMHLRTAILCFMCKSNFFNYSEILCHMCPGEANKFVIFDIKFRCCLCDLDQIPSAFRLMVHLRKAHFACDVCLEDCQNQSRLSSHVWKHKLHHLCYRCGIAYRNKSDITKHLFWKHGTESVLCKRCLQKRWPHVYHFCIPPSSFICEICNLQFSRAMYLKVHKRLHTGDAPYPCTEDNCEQKFISRKLLLKHLSKHAEEIEQQKLLAINAKVESENKNVESDKIKDKLDDDVKAETKSDSGKNSSDNVSTEITSVDGISSKANDVSGEGNNADGSCENDTTKSKKEKKKKKNKKDTNKTSLEDEIMNLPAPNLSESDSSDNEEQTVKEKNLDLPNTPAQSANLPPSPIIDVPKIMLSSASDTGNDGDDDDDDDKDKVINHAPVMDIWENFKAFQASQKANKDKESDDDDVNGGNVLSTSTPILHVSQSDHDYCTIFHKSRPEKGDKEEKCKVETTKIKKEEEKDEKITDTSVTIASIDNLSLDDKKKKERTESEKANTTDSSSTPSPKKKQKQQRERTKSGSESSSGSSSSSSSSCSCGSNCSCSGSSSSSSGSSSSSEDSDSSTSEGKKRIAAKRAAKEEKRKRNKSDSSKANSSDIIDVVTTDGIDAGNPLLEVLDSITTITEMEMKAKITPEPIIQEADLETDESDTDEDFYDEHPQKLATQLLAEKRRQLMMQTCMSPSNNFDIVENSRPSTPSLPEEMMKEKKVKIKKKKRERKTQKHNPITAVPPFNLNIPSTQQNGIQQIPHEVAVPTPPGPVPPIPLDMTPPVSNLTSLPSSVQIPTHTPAPVSTIQSRLSTGSNSDAEAPLKRSKRTRRPNKFYGYSSDDENSASSNYATGLAAFKPIPPPNFTWRKEDLPTPPSKSKSTKSSHSKKNSQSSATLAAMATGGNASTSNTPQALPPIPPIIIRPGSLGTSPKPPVIEHNVPVIEPLRIPVPPVPVHHIQPPQIYPLGSSSRESQESDSSDEDRLHIPITQASYHHSGGGRKSSSKGSHTKMVGGLNSRNNSIFSQSSTVSTSILPSLQPPLQLIATPSPPPAPPRERKIPPALLPTPPDFARIQYFRRNNIRYPIRPPAGARPPREGESIYCYCRCPYDEVSEMIACDGEDCLIEWFHFECVGILVPPKGKWFCPECRPLYPNEMTEQTTENNNGINNSNNGNNSNNSNSENSGNNYPNQNSLMMMST